MKVFLKVCDCGFRMEWRPGQAGYVVPCTSCGDEHRVDSLRELRLLRCVERHSNYPSRFQFGLKTLLILIVPFALVAWVSSLVGVFPVVLVIGLPTLYVLATTAMAAVIQFGPGLMNELYFRAFGTRRP